MRVGCVLIIDKKANIEKLFTELIQMGMHSCQLVCWDRSVLTDMKKASEINMAVEKYGVDITAFWCGWEGPCVWNLYDGQETLGLIPEAYRFQRVQTLMEGSDFAKAIHVTDLVTHVGFIPENPYDPKYHGVIVAVRKVAEKCKENGQFFLFETGQETPTTLRRAISDIGMDNLGINLDPSNLILYGKANPVDALDTIGEYVRNVHGKDGLYPTDGRELGKEVPVGEGKVNFPRFITRLKEIGYNGDITIEREISGPEQKRDIIAAKDFLEKLINES